MLWGSNHGSQGAGVASAFGSALSRVASACTYFVWVVGRDRSINNRLHGEGQATHSGKQKLRQETPRASWSKCKWWGERVTTSAAARGPVVGSACVGGVEQLRSGL